MGAHERSCPLVSLCRPTDLPLPSLRSPLRTPAVSRLLVRSVHTHFTVIDHLIPSVPLPSSRTLPRSYHFENVEDKHGPGRPRGEGALVHKEFA